MQYDTIIVLDFGSQYNQLIVRRIREFKVYSELLPFDTPWEEILKRKPKGIILSGGPSSVYAHNAPKCAKEVFTSSIPVLGICYGHQLMALNLNGIVQRGKKGEYGKAIFTQLNPHIPNPLFKDIATSTTVWMSHFDTVIKVPEKFSIIGKTETCNIAGMQGSVGTKKINKLSIQFHPEVIHTSSGRNIIRNFLLEICKCKQTWTSTHFIKETIQKIKNKIGHDHVICAVSGGVDSSVLAALISKAIGKQVHNIFVDTGLLRKGEPEEVIKAFQKIKIPLTTIRAKNRFIDKLRNISDPEQKRKIIGHEFIKIFEENATKIKNLKYI